VTAGVGSMVSVLAIEGASVAGLGFCRLGRGEDGVDIFFLAWRRAAVKGRVQYA
jgi:hypothetical protein